MATWQKTVTNIATALAVVGALWMALVVGISNAANIVIDPAAVDADVVTSLGGIDFVDRIAVAGVFITLLGSAGLAIITPGSGNPPFVNTILRYAPLIIGFVAFSAFGTEAWDLVTGNRTWANYDDTQNSYILFLASSMVAGFVSLFRK